MRPYYAEIADRIEAAVLSPTGVRAAFEARGEILTVPAEKGDARNLTRTPGVRGVAPDIEVELDPKAWRQGRDTQPEKAVQVALDLLEKNPPPKKPKRPAYPNYHPKAEKAVAGSGG